MRNIFFMQRALELAAQGGRKVSPNPQVGAVVVRGGKIIGEGFHQRVGGPHAEIHAFRSVKNSRQLKGATLYVTLEPCCHQGRTPPCTQGIIQAGIKKVVIAMRDPDSKVSGRGVAQLKRAGVVVEEAVLAEEAQALNRAYSHHRRTGLPWVTIKTAMSLDGRTVAADGNSQWITGPAARREGHKLRASHDAVMVGIGTALADDPQLTVRGAKTARPPVRVVVDSRLRLSLRSKLVRSAKQVPVWVVTTVGQSPRKKSLERAGVRVFSVTARSGKVDLQQALHALAREGILSVLVEGGMTLAAALIRENLVQEWVGFMAVSKLLGEAPLSRAKRFREVWVNRVGDDLMIRSR